jgi:purine nucleosidase
MPEKILLDTDIGSDIDDAVALAYLLSQPKCELMGITTVSGEAVKRAMLASALCKAAGRSVPIYPGAEAPLIAPQRQPECPQAAALERWPHDKVFPKGEAVEFLRRTIRKYPGEITLLAIGPLTNVALLISADPEVPSLLKRLVLMCGVFTNGLAGAGPLEWNAICDPHASAIVYNTPIGIHRSIGLDVTCRVTMDRREVRERFKAKILQPVYDFAKVWFEGRELLTFHDPLAAATIFDEGICKFEKGTVDVELLSDRSKGLTYWQPCESGRHEVALGVDRERFFEHYFSVVNSLS